VALFFPLSPPVFHAMHEWLSMVLLLPFAIHVWKNWRPLVGYVQRGTLLVPVIASVVIAAPFAAMALTGQSGGVSPPRMARILTQARLADLAPLLNTTTDKLTAKLVERGYKVASPDDSLATIAASVGAPATKALADALPR